MIESTNTHSRPAITVGVLALQGAFAEHVQLLGQAAHSLSSTPGSNSAIGNVATSAVPQWSFVEVRTSEQLARCDALIVPGGESTTMSLVAARSGLLEPLRDFVKLHRRPVWGTCAGLILLAESANRTTTKRGGQELIGGLDVRVRRNHFGRQTESFEADLDLPFLHQSSSKGENHKQDSGEAAAKGMLTQEGQNKPFRAIFIRAPVVERILPTREGEQVEELERDLSTVVAPSKKPETEEAKRYVGEEVQVLARLPQRPRAEVPPGPEVTSTLQSGGGDTGEGKEEDIVAVRQGNVFGTSFHPELTGDSRIHEWWLGEVMRGLAVR